MRIALVAGARPNFLKVAPVHTALAARPGLEPQIVHTGQHYDPELSALFFQQLGIPEPVANFQVGSGTHGQQTGAIMIAMERWLATAPPDLVLVVGDVNSTLAATLVAAKALIPVAHVEAGLRSRDRTMPEEINRVVVDALAELLFATEPAAVENLRAEGIPDEKVHLVGNVMIDTLLRHRELARGSGILEKLDLGNDHHAVVTLHRPANVDDPRRLAGLLRCLGEIARDLPVIFPLHPRTRQRIQQHGLSDLLAAPGLVATASMPYLDFLQLMATAQVVLTDSGGIQEETTVLGVPCLTLRRTTERPITVDEGTNRVVGSDPDAVLAAWREVRDRPPPEPRRPAGWDGGAAERIADVICRWAESRPAPVPR